MPASAVTPGGLAALGYLNATIISQNGADSTYAADGFLGVVFTAQETVGGPLYRYEIALSGVTTTQVINTRTLVDTTQPTATIGALTATGNGTFQATITLSEPSTDFTVGDLSVTNATATLTGSGTNYVATLTPQNNGTIELFIPAGVFTDAAGNLNLASNTVTTVQAVTNTQRLIQAFQNARATSLATNQPGLTRFLQRSGSGVLDTSVTQGSGYLNFASDPSNPVWFNLTGNWSSQDNFDSSYALAVLGAHRQVNSNLLIGAMLQLDYAETENGPASVDGTGWLIGPYVVAKLPSQPVFFEGRALYGQADNDISPLGTYTDSFDSDRWLVQSRVTGEIKRGALTLMPLLDVSYASDDQKAYTDSLGNLIPQQDFSLTTARLGMDFSHPIQVSRGAMELTGGLSGIWSTTSGTGTVPGVTPIGDTARARADLGFDYRLENNSLLAANVFYDGIGESGFENYSVNLLWQMSF
ncbi:MULTISPECIES: Ig-like domain-containing protein [unclassified Ruegeria]|uniref:Ig-like domain-containing protein n=1 Tax=unclassified Ruegeria TaxID=2625375 RepID=UPI00149298EB|nr:MULTISPECIES: Ig-like domain-containing protein [unclassified Ruegeria]NOD77179.1 autotransporter outer membrane beta-barrel domain-containing protein [Ruegeria sp. HKCCD4332]NOG08090.1 autotransporter outer membrane beta-barrel domain-containing protein [Ruegeria sp. HKCCD4315]